MYKHESKLKGFKNIAKKLSKTLTEYTDTAVCVYLVPASMYYESTQYQLHEYLVIFYIHHIVCELKIFLQSIDLAWQ